MYGVCSTYPGLYANEMIAITVFLSPNPHLNRDVCFSGHKYLLGYHMVCNRQ